MKQMEHVPTEEFKGLVQRCIDDGAGEFALDLIEVPAACASVGAHSVLSGLCDEPVFPSPFYLGRALAALGYPRVMLGVDRYTVIRNVERWTAADYTEVRAYIDAREELLATLDMLT